MDAYHDYYSDPHPAPVAVQEEKRPESILLETLAVASIFASGIFLYFAF